MKTMLTILMVTVLLVGFGVLIGTASAQFSRSEDAIQYRKAVMIIMVLAGTEIKSPP